MKYIEEKGNLFEVSNEYKLVHCISSDFALGKGIAKQFVEKYDVKNKLLKTYKRNNWEGKGYCLQTDNVYNLVTKKFYFNKPTLNTLKESLLDLKNNLLKENITKIAMPQIGCGLDDLEWNMVRVLINQLFTDTDIEIKVCIL